MGLQVVIARTVINRLMVGIASIDQLAIDKRKKSILATIRLEGEQSAIHLTLMGYELGEGEHADHIRIAQVGADRSWLEKAANRFLTERWLPLPKAARLLL
jgi:hypothetical protein